MTQSFFRILLSSLCLLAWSICPAAPSLVTAATDSSVVADGAVEARGQNDVIVEAAVDRHSLHYEEHEEKSGVFTSGGSLSFGNRQLDTRTNGVSTYNVGSLVGSLEGNVEIRAGEDYRQTGSAVSAAEGDVSVEARNILIEAEEETKVYDYEQRFKQSGLTLAVSAPVIEAAQSLANAAKDVGQSKDERINAMSAANAGMAGFRAYEAISGVMANGASGGGSAFSVSITYGEQKNEQTKRLEQSAAAPSQVLAGGRIDLDAKGAEENPQSGNILIVGSDLMGKEGVGLNATGEIDFLAAEQKLKEREKNRSSGWNVGVALTFGDGMSFGITAGGNVGKGFANGEATSWRNTRVESDGTIEIESGKDTKLIGAQVKGERVEVEAENLILQSLQETATFEGEQKNASLQVTVGYGASVSGSYSQSEVEADYRSVTEQTGILAGDGGYQIEVRNNTDLTGAIITSTEAAEEANKNSLTTGTLTSRDLQNHAKYDAEGFGIGGGAGFNADFGLGEKATAQGSQKTDANGNLQTGKASLTASGSTGYGRDKEEDESVTRSGINTKNVTITDEEKQQNLTGKTAAETIASLHTSTTTQTAEQNSGYLENNFDRKAVEDEIALQVEVTQQFSENAQYAQRQIRAKEEGLRDEAKRAEATGDFERAAKLYGEADEWQKGGVLLNMAAGGLLAPTNTAGGILASTLAPGIAYEIGQYFKEQNTEGSAAHLIAHAILGGAVQAAGGNDALAGALAAGGAEAIAPILSNYLYGKEASELKPEEKETISAITGLAGNAIGGMTGNGAADVVGGGQVAKTAVENNQQRPPVRRAGQNLPIRQEIINIRAARLIRAINEKMGGYSEARDPTKINNYSEAEIAQLERMLREIDPGNSLLPKQNRFSNPVLLDDPYNPLNVLARIKPLYEANPAHNIRSSLYNPRKTPEPDDAQSAYESGAVISSMGVWYAKGQNGYYRYFSGRAGPVHFSGIIEEHNIPKEVLKLLGKQ
jgi:filamentous hemagglutinin